MKRVTGKFLLQKLRLSHYSATILFLTFLGAILRLVSLGRDSLWFDEAQSAYFSELPFYDLIDTILLEGLQHSPLYYFLLSAFPRGEFIEIKLRLLSVFFGVISIPFIAKIGKDWGGTRTGWISAALLAINPIAIWYSREARMYALLTWISLGVLFSFRRFLKPSNPHAGLQLYIFTTLGMYTHHFAFFLPVIQLAFFCATFKKNFHLLRKWTLVMLASGLSFIPWLYVIVKRGEYYFSSATPLHPKIYSPVITLINFTTGYTGGPGVLEIATLLITVLLLYRVMRVAGDDILLLSIWFLLPILVTFLISFRLPMYIDRYLLVSLPAFILLLCGGISKLERKNLRLFFTAVMLIVMLFGSIRMLLDEMNYQRADWRGLVAYLEENNAFVEGNIVSLKFQDYMPFYVYGANLNSIRTVLVFRDVEIPELSEYYQQQGFWFVLPYPTYTQHYISKCDPNKMDFRGNLELQDWYDTILQFKKKTIEFECIRLEYYSLP